MRSADPSYRSVDVLAAALNQMLDDPVASKRFAELGAAIAEKGRRGPGPLDALVRSEIARLTPIKGSGAEVRPQGDALRTLPGLASAHEQR